MNGHHWVITYVLVCIIHQHGKRRRFGIMADLRVSALVHACEERKLIWLFFSLQLRRRLYPSPWEELPENVPCDPDIYGRLATFLTRVYKIESGRNKGEPLGIDSVLGYLGSLLNQAKVKFKSVGSDRLIEAVSNLPWWKLHDRCRPLASRP